MKNMNITPHRFRIVAVIAALALFTAACANNDDPATEGDTNGETVEETNDDENTEDDTNGDATEDVEDVEDVEDGLTDEELAVEAHEKFVAANDQFLRDGDVDALREVADADAVDRLVAFRESIEADGSEVAGFRTSQVQDVSFQEVTDSYLVRDCAIDQRRIYDPEVSADGLSDEDLTMVWLRIDTDVVVDEDGNATVVNYRDEWDEEADQGGRCLPAHQRERIEEATAELAVATFAGMATNDPDDYVDVFEEEWLDTYFGRMDADRANRLSERENQVGVRIIGADPYLASVVVCTYGFGRTVDAETGEVLGTDSEWGDSRTGQEFFISGVDTGEFRVRDIIANEASDWTGWCNGEVDFTHEFNTLSDPSVVGDGPRTNTWANPTD